MNNVLTSANLVGWLFGGLLVMIGLLNVFWVHPVPGLGYLLLSFLYLPPATSLLREKLGFTVPVVVKIMLGLVLTMFTLGVSDLGDMIDKW